MPVKLSIKNVYEVVNKGVLPLLFQCDILSYVEKLSQSTHTDSMGRSYKQSLDEV